MLIVGASTSKKLQLVTDAAASIRVHQSWIQTDTSTPPVVQDLDGEFIAAVATAATTDIIIGAASRKKRLGFGSYRNEHASTTCGVTLQMYDGSNTETLIKASLLAGETLVFTGTSWIHYDVNGVAYSQTNKIDIKRMVANDVTNATTSFADITGLTQDLKSGRKYGFEVCLFHQTNATTTGAQFGVNIGATPTLLNVHGWGQITSSVTAAAFGASAMVTAVDTAMVVETTGPGAVNMLAMMFGTIQPSADGTFAVRSKSEVAAAGGLVIKAGSWLRIWEMDS